MCEMFDLQRVEIGFQTNIYLVSLDVRLAGLRVSFHHEPGTERPGREVLRLDVVRYKSPEELDEMFGLIGLVLAEEGSQ